ncbi:hypothetical protein [Saccharopolyspora sp. NPDC049426]
MNREEGSSPVGGPAVRQRWADVEVFAETQRVTVRSEAAHHPI